MTEYNRSIKAEAIYDAGLLNCARLYSSSGDHSFFIFYSRLHQLLILGIISQMRALVIDNRVGNMVRIYRRCCQGTKQFFKLNVNDRHIGQLRPN